MREMNVEHRRRLLRASGIATVGLAVWQKPVIRHVALPAHAQTTQVSDLSESNVDGAESTTLSPDDIIRVIIDPLVLGKSPHR
ncbi:MAG: hypothetical protein AAF402_15055 [Pseudomonadota bacterium]